MRTRITAVLVAAVLVGTLVSSGASAKPFEPGTSTAACAPAGGTLTATPGKLWPPNHTLRNVTITSTGAAFVVTGVTHEEEGLEKGSTAQPQNEPDSEISDAAGDGVAADPALVKLRAERLSKPKDGRTYTIAVTCGDPAAGGGTASLIVTVPHSRKKA